MANVRKTQKDLFGEIRAIVEQYGTTEQVEFIDKKVEQLERKSTTKTMTATQKANEDIKAEIVNVLKDFEGKASIKDIQEQHEILAGLSNQKISALLKQLVDTNVVVKTIDKKKAYFEIA